MKYLCLTYEAEETSTSRHEWDALRQATVNYVETLRDSGHLIATNAGRYGQQRGGEIRCVHCA
jgi:hypothetical protein